LDTGSRIEIGLLALFEALLVRDDPTMWCAGLMLAALMLVLVRLYALRSVTPAELATFEGNGMRPHSVVASSGAPTPA